MVICVYDPSGKLGLTDPSPGGGTVPVRERCSCGLWGHWSWDHCERVGDPPRPLALLLVTEDGTPDPVGMARAREVLAGALGLDTTGGACFFRMRLEPVWRLECRRSREFDAEADESAPDALARLLARHAGCEVIRG